MMTTEAIDFLLYAAGVACLETVLLLGVVDNIDANNPPFIEAGKYRDRIRKVSARRRGLAVAAGTVATSVCASLFATAVFSGGHESMFGIPTPLAALVSLCVAVLAAFLAAHASMAGADELYRPPQDPIAISLAADDVVARGFALPGETSDLKQRLAVWVDFRGDWILQINPSSNKFEERLKLRDSVSLSCVDLAACGSSSGEFPDQTPDEEKHEKNLGFVVKTMVTKHPLRYSWPVVPTLVVSTIPLVSDLPMFKVLRGDLWRDALIVAVSATLALICITVHVVGVARRARGRDRFATDAFTECVAKIRSAEDIPLKVSEARIIETIEEVFHISSKLESLTRSPRRARLILPWKRG